MLLRLAVELQMDKKCECVQEWREAETENNFCTVMFYY